MSTLTEMSVELQRKKDAELRKAIGARISQQSEAQAKEYEEYRIRKESKSKNT